MTKHKFLYGEIRSAIVFFIVMLIALVSCDKTDITDTSGFKLYYMGLTDIGPSMEGNISVPTFHNGHPSEFKITNVTRDGKEVENELFTIDETNGAIRMTSQKNSVVGLYKISVQCSVDGEKYRFKDAVEVHLLPLAPKELILDHSSMDILLDKIGDEEIPFSAIRTDNHHISIKNIQLASVTLDDQLLDKNLSKSLFSVNKKGVKVIGSKDKFKAGIYKVSLKVLTAVSGKDDTEGIYKDAMVLKVNSKPTSMIYAPNEGRIEEETEKSGATTFSSSLPEIEGTKEDVQYEIASIEPATDKILIDRNSGVIKIESGHQLKKDRSYYISVRVKNKYASEGIVFPNVFKIDVVDFISPISEFEYDKFVAVEGSSFSIAKKEEFKGDNVMFEWVKLPPELEGKVSLNPVDGTVTAEKGNSIAIGEYSMEVKASNAKNEMTAVCHLTIEKNENKFSYVDYKNNLGLKDDSHQLAAQYRFHKAEELENFEIVPTTDISKNVKEIHWEIEKCFKINPTSFKLNSETGAITLTSNSLKNLNKKKNALEDTYTTAMIVIKVTVGKGENKYSKSTPVFLQMVLPKDNVTVEYTPFVLQVDPTKTYRSAAPKLGGLSGDSFFMDYRRTFSFELIHKVKDDHLSGSIGAKNTGTINYLQSLWKKCDVDNSGSKLPVSFYDSKGKAKQDLTSKTLLYVDGKNKYAIVVNSNLWRYDGNVVEGVFFGQMTYTKETGAEQLNKSGNQIFPVAIWFNKNFK